jgi:hypothetical protein
MHEMTPEEIDEAMGKGEKLWEIYKYQKLSPDQIDRAIEKGEDLGYLYEFQKLPPDQIDRAIEKGEDLGYLYEFQKLSPDQIDRAMEKRENLRDIYEHQKLLPDQIDRAIEKGEKLDFLYDYQKLLPDQIDRAIEKGEELEDLYYHQKLLPDQIDRAIEKGEKLDFLYDYQKLLPDQIDRAIEKGEALAILYIYQELPPSQIDRAIEKGERLGVLYEYQKLPPDQIDRAMDKGEKLGTLYRRQKLLPDQIDKAIGIGEHFDILFSYQEILPEQIDRAINIGAGLEFLYTSPLATEEQKKTILKKLNIPAYEVLLESPLWKSVIPTDLIKAVNIFNESVSNKVDMAPVYDLVGVYPATNPFDIIKLRLADKGYYTKEGDFDYGYYADNSGREKKIRLGRIIKDYPKLVAEYGEVKPALKSIYRETGSLSPLSENLEIVISNNPIDIAGKSTGKAWTSCETISSSADYGWPPLCGWCDDIKANNLIAYIKRVGEDEWIGRCMIRWCIREDDKRPDALIEKYYGNIFDPNLPLYRWIMEYNLNRIVRGKGYSGMPGAVSCKTPYTFTGYLDSADSAKHEDSYIEYHLGKRGEEREEKRRGEKKVYYPKLAGD